MYCFYSACALCSKAKSAKSDSLYVCVTEHIKSENERILALMNYSPTERTVHIVCDGYALNEVLTIHNGTAAAVCSEFDITLPGNTGLVVVLA